MKHILFTLSLVLTIGNGFAQSTNDGETRAERNQEFRERPFKDKLAYGGELSMYFGTTSYINVAPLIGYRLNPDLTIGVGPSYQYLAVRWGNGPSNVNRTHIFGGRAFARHELGRMFFIHGEYEILNLEGYNSFNNSLGRMNVNMAGLGLGYKNSFGDFAYYYVMVLYDFIQEYNTPYPFTPIIIKAGFIFGK